MTDVFKVIEVRDQGDEEKGSICLGIVIWVGGKKTSCPISKVCRTYEDFAAEVGAIQKQLQQTLERARYLVGKPLSKGPIQFMPEMTPEEIWVILSNIKDEALFVESFNSLDSFKRKDVAEYVLTGCNIFSGNASIFSARYDNDTGIME